MPPKRRRRIDPPTIVDIANDHGDEDKQKDTVCPFCLEDMVNIDEGFFWLCKYITVHGAHALCLAKYVSQSVNSFRVAHNVARRAAAHISSIAMLFAIYCMDYIGPNPNYLSRFRQQAAGPIRRPLAVCPHAKP
jgi:hypothetical protein